MTGYTAYELARGLHIKYSPGQARDAHGRWSRGGGRFATVNVAGATAKLQNDVRDTEQRICDSSIERAYAWTPAGDRILTKAGDSKSVEFTEDELNRLKGAVFTHNHPGWQKYSKDDPRRDGNSFSREDIALAKRSELAEMRAVTDNYVYTLRPPASGWGSVGMAHLVQANDRMNTNTRMEFTKMIAAKQLTYQEAEAYHWHHVNTRLSLELGLQYERVPRR